MSGDITFFDVETPNRNNSRICSVGVIRTDNNGYVQYENHFLVNPEQGFDDRNIAIHGIKPSMVKEKPTFDELWQTELFPVFDNSTLVAHNDNFDLNVLEKTLGAYGFEEPEFPYICTMESAQRVLPGLQDYRLPTLSQHYGVSLPHHHDAIYDAKACEGVFWGLRDEFGKDALHVNIFVPTYSFVPTYVASNRSKLMTDLYGIAVGISLDGVISRNELGALEEWADGCSSLLDDPLLKIATDLIGVVLRKSAISTQEQSTLMNLTRPFVTDGHNTQETVCFQQLLGIIKGISADEHVSELEASRLKSWLSYCNAASYGGEFSVIEKELDDVLEDGVIKRDEEDRLLSLFGKIINPMNSTSSAVSYEGKRFVLSGNFSFGEKNEVAAVIKERGGEVSDSVSGKVSYVVVGAEGSERYANGEYGSKVKKAMELQDKGKPIQIIMESDLCL